MRRWFTNPSKIQVSVQKASAQGGDSGQNRSPYDVIGNCPGARVEKHQQQLNYSIILTLLLSRAGNKQVGHINSTHKNTVITQLTLSRSTEAGISDVGFNRVLIQSWIPGFCDVDEFEEVFKVLWGTYYHLLRRGDFQVWVQLSVNHCFDKTQPVKLQKIKET